MRIIFLTCMIYACYDMIRKEDDMKSYSSRELIKMAESNHHFRHSTYKHKLTIPHPRKDFKPKTLRNILKDMGP
ncbi:type II toxin-antitoxin system HicA family toxin [Paenibacillus oceani]|nr:type II toxin-antitoxin system HicA family toxin [Paenibacillus oceani]